MRVFISHTFSEEDQKLAIKLQKILAESEIVGYLAEKKKEYDLLIRDKIRKEIENSDHMIAIVTNHARESASVNQEIGYALREGIKPIIMLENNAKSGVLTHGIEPEEFSRENFEAHCFKVTEFVLKKGRRGKINEQELNKLIDAVYRPCYNQMTNVYQNINSIIESVPPNPWSKIEHYWKLKTEPEMKQLFENYSRSCKLWEMTLRDYDSSFKEQLPHLGIIITKAFEASNLLHGGDHFQFSHNSTMRAQDWLNAFRYIIFDTKINNAEDLYLMLSEYSFQTNNGHYKRLVEWWEENNGIYSNILDAIPELVQKFKFSTTKDQLIELRKMLKMSIEVLTKALEKKLQ